MEKIYIPSNKINDKEKNKMQEETTKILEIKEKLEKITKFYNELKKGISKDELTPTRVYFHEMTSIVGALQETINVYNEGLFTEDSVIEIYDCVRNKLEKENLLEKITKLEGFTKNQLISNNPYDIKKIIEKEIEVNKRELKKANIKTYLSGEAEIYLKPEAIATLISTNFGNAFKWAPNNSEIYFNLNEEKNYIKINLENEITNEPIRKIGEGKGIGTLLTNKIIEEISGKKEIYTIPKINPKNVEVWGIEFYLPKNPNLIN